MPSKTLTCEITVAGYWDLWPSHLTRPDGTPVKNPVRSSYRLDRTITRPVREMVRMKGAQMVAIKHHLETCPECRPSEVMALFVKRAMKIGYVNGDLMKMARAVAKRHPSRGTRSALKALDVMRTVRIVHMS